MSKAKQYRVCCDGLAALVANPENSPLCYLPYKREFVLTVPRRYLTGANEIALKFKITHCPRCGSKFPDALTNEWYEVLEKGFGITGYVDQDMLQQLPEEFRTEKWWKKRKL